MILIKVDLFLTDPPYNVAYEGSAGTIQNDDMSKENFREFLFNAFNNAFEHMKEGASFYVWHSSSEQVTFEKMLYKAGLDVRQQLIWVKSSLIMGRSDYHWRHEPCFYGWKGGAAHNWYGDRKQSTVLEFDKPSINEEHPTMKPLDLIGYQIANSTKKGNIVLDLFGGSGSTLIACEQLGRKCRTMELEPRFCDVIIKRWENETGLKAEKVRTWQEQKAN